MGNKKGAGGEGSIMVRLGRIAAETGFVKLCTQGLFARWIHVGLITAGQFAVVDACITESCSFVRDVNGEISFSSAYEQGTLLETRTNKTRTTRDFATWSGEATFDEPLKKFKATA